MITLYTGTPGSGKSLHVTKIILDRLEHTRPHQSRYVICNYNLKTSSDKFFYMDNNDITPEFLIDFALSFHMQGKEGQSLLVIDEASILFNCRDMGRSDRDKWIQFFQQHRKLGYNVILITQLDRMLDRQIRGFVEYEFMHRKLNNAGGWGMIFNILHIPMFWVIERWYGAKMTVNKGFFPYSIKASKAYNTFDTFFDYARQPKKIISEEQRAAVQAVANFAQYLINQRSQEENNTPPAVGRGACGVPATRWVSVLDLLFRPIGRK